MLLLSETSVRFILLPRTSGLATSPSLWVYKNLAEAIAKTITIRGVARPFHIKHLKESSFYNSKIFRYFRYRLSTSKFNFWECQTVNAIAAELSNKHARPAFGQQNINNAK